MLAQSFESIKITGLNNVDIQLKKEIKDSINELRELAKLNSEKILEIMQASDRYGGITTDTKESTYKDVVKILNMLKVPEEEINQILDKCWFKWVNFDFIRLIKDYTGPQACTIQMLKYDKQKYEKMLLSQEIENPEKIQGPEKIQERIEEINNQLKKFNDADLYLDNANKIQKINLETLDEFSKIIKCLLDLKPDKQLDEIFSYYQNYIKKRQHVDIEKWKKMKAKMLEKIKASQYL